MAYIEGTIIGPGSHMATAKNGQKYVTASKAEKKMAYPQQIKGQLPATTSSNKTAAATPVAVSGGGGGGYGGGGGGMDIDLAAIWREYIEQLRKQAQEAYDRNMKRISESYDKGSSSLQNNLTSSRNQLTSTRDASNLGITRDAEASLKAAYINNMMARRDVRQNMSAQGLNGGAAESTMASLENNYGVSRNNIETTRNRNLEDLERTYNNNIASAQQAYNTAAADLYAQKMQQEQAADNALTNFMAGYASQLYGLQVSNGDYLNSLRNAVANQQGYSFAPTAATNGYNAVNMTQASPVATGSNYAQYLAQQALQQNTNLYRSQLQAAGYNNAAINQYFASIGLK